VVEKYFLKLASLRHLTEILPEEIDIVQKNKTSKTQIWKYLQRFHVLFLSSHNLV